MIMKPTPQQIDEQVNLERDAIRQGLKRLQDQTLKLENQNYASATIYGISSIDSLLPDVAEQIDNTVSRIHERGNGVAFKDIHQYLADIDSQSAAAIACKITFDKVFGFKEGSNQTVKVCEAIGKAVEDECQMRYYEHNFPGLLHTLKKNYWHKCSGTTQRLTNIKLGMKRCGVQTWTPWKSTIRIKLGGWLLDCIMKASKWFHRVHIRQGRKNEVYILPTAEFMDIKDEVIANAELFSPLAWPMLIPPRDWSNEESGGYILNEVMNGHDLVRRGNHSSIQGEIPLAFLNKIQKVAYTLNKFTVIVAATLMKREICVGKFLPIVHHPLPPKPVDIAENKEARVLWNRECTKVYNRQKAEIEKSCRTRMTMDTVFKFIDKDRFFIPWSFDYRGRAYPIPSFLTPQDTDFGKSLIRSADESYITESGKKWLAFQVATTFGLDKETMANRLLWAAHNHSLITRVATEPIDNIGDWEGADEPWQFLAACEEYHACVITKTRTTTGLFVATDATCSGLQILAGLARDKETAQLVNVLPSERPQDAYQVVADTAKPNCPMHIREVMDRKTVKRTVMTIPYNAKPFSNRSYIRDALLEKGIEIDKDDLTVTVKAVRDAMQKVVPGPMKVMKWIEDEVSKAIKRGAEKLEWVTPSGFIVNQRIMKKNIIRLDLQLLGRCQISAATDDTDEVDINRHRAATAPNLIHSLDASLLHLSIDRFDKPIALIHDSVLTQSVDMDELSAIIRETYMHLFAEHDYLNDFASQIGAETEPPIIGDLKPESVINSTYFFC
jgi:DNA-directed RNA polymerase